MKKNHLVPIISLGVFGLVACGGSNPSPTPVTITHWYDVNDWWNYCSNSGVGGVEQAVKEDIGKEVSLTVNGKEHKIRLIDIDKDEDSAGNKIHCTFEFANLLSDSNGYCLAIQWNDISRSKLNEANYQYSISTIHSALNDENANDVNWAEKGSSTWSYRYKNVSVLKMLSAEFKSALKTAKKIVNEYTLGSDGKYSWAEKTLNDKLFLLTPCEMGYTNYTYPDYQESSTKPYSFYEDCNAKTSIAKRIKKQVNEGEVYRNAHTISTGHQCGITVTSYAGINEGADEGNFYFLRSPYAESNNSGNRVWAVTYDGSYDNQTQGAYKVGFSIAPAFCI